LQPGSDCYNLFNSNGKGIDPALLLETLATPGGSILGNIHCGRITDVSTVATAAPVNVRVDIKINNDANGLWGGSDSNDAIMLLHELGHAYDILGATTHPK
jgi:hypothetical protein